MERLKHPKITEKLNKDNYRSWRVEMHAYFKIRSLWGVVSGKELRGDDGEWTKKDAVALTAIRISCSARVVEKIDNASTAKDAWEALLRCFRRTESNLENSGPFYQEKLNGTNYTTWEINMKNYLEAEGLWGVVSGEELRAISREWEKKNAAALRAIQINCNKIIYYQMVDCCSTAKDAWEAFFTVFRQFASTSEISGPIDQEKLDNYRTWRDNMKKYFEDKGLWGVVTGEELRGEKLPRRRRQMGGEWTIKNAKALVSIRTNCGETVFPMINNFYMAKDSWETLLKRFRPPLGILEPEERGPDNQAKSNCYPIEKAETLLEKYRVIKSGSLDHLARINGSELILPENGYTALHVAVSTGQPRVVDYFLGNESIPAPMLDTKKRTALALAAYHGKLEIARKLAYKYPRWLFIKDDRENIPLVAACEGGHVDTTCFLYPETFKYLGKARAAVYEEDHEFSPHIRQYDDTEHCVIIRCLESKMFGIAWEVLQTQSDPRKMFLHSSSNPLLTLAETPITLWKQRVSKAKDAWEALLRCFRIESNSEQSGPPLYQGINQIYTHDCPLKILKIMCKKISLLNDNDLRRSCTDKAMFAAVKNGNLEFVTQIIERNPDIMWKVDESKRDLLMCAIAHRQKNIARFIHGLDEWRNEIVNFDEDGCNLLHMAGELGPYPQRSRIFGAALQMQRELQWFKEVESIVPYYFRGSKNKENQTPSEAFTTEHEALMINAEKWMKDAANSYSIVGALITTIMFAAAFTVPGGNDQTEGFPIFRHKVLFKTFIVSVAASFSTAATSVMLFLGILTSRYAPKDYLVSLPTKLMVGLLTLLISMAVMMVAFSAAIVLMLQGKLWAKILTVSLGSLPVIFFALQNFSLLKEIFVSTYLWRLFEKEKSPYTRPSLSTENVREISANDPTARTASTNEPPVETASTNVPSAEIASSNEPPTETTSANEPTAKIASTSSEPPAEVLVEIST